VRKRRKKEGKQEEKVAGEIRLFSFLRCRCAPEDAGIEPSAEILEQSFGG
jgi:hypothetical protein